MSVCDPEKIVDREKELALVSEKVSRLARGEPFAPHERVIHFVGPSGIGKSCLLEKCYLVFSPDSKIVPILIRLEKIGNGRDEFISEFLKKIYEEFCGRRNIKAKEKNASLSKYSQDILREINKRNEGCLVVLFLDEMNILQREELQKIEEHLLIELIESNKRFVLVTASRSPVGLNHFPLRSTPVNTFRLSAFDKKNTGDQLERLKPGSSLVADKVLALGNGVPGNNTKLAERVIGSPPDIANELEAVQALLTDVRVEINGHFHPITEAICILREFFPEDVVLLINTHPALGGKWNEASADELFRELKQVQIGPGGLINWDRDKKSWTMDEPTRTLFEKELKMRAPNLWRKLHCTAYKMYEKWGDEFNSQLYQEKAAYHLDRLQSAGMNCDGMEG